MMGKETVCVPPLHVICFHCNVAGSETATFGLASHAPVVFHQEDVITDEPDRRETRQFGGGPSVEAPTRRRGFYSWSNFTKTQYAGNPKYGGIPNFVRAHLSVCRTMDEAKRLGMSVSVNDDARYWRYRNEAKLIEQLENWNRLVVGVVGHLGDALGGVSGRIVAPITDRPDFEHLEAVQAKTPAKVNTNRQRRRKGVE